jgi:hypothetical protein
MTAFLLGRISPPGSSGMIAFLLCILSAFALLLAGEIISGGSSSRCMSSSSSRSDLVGLAVIEKSVVIAATLVVGEGEQAMIYIIAL